MSKEQLLKLRKDIEIYQKEYYTLDSPSISDYEYDNLFKKLQELEEKYPELYDENSPSQRVGGKVLDYFEKVTHKEPMLSLEDVFSIEELKNWANKLVKNYGNLQFCVEHKIDGLAISLRYENGILKYGITRGDGSVGENVTNNVKTIKSIPLKIDFKEDFEIRGEVYMPKNIFNEINQKRQLDGLELLANPRNAASGTMRQLDSSVVFERKLDVYLYNVLNSDKNSHYDSLLSARDLGFKINPYTKLFDDIDMMCEYVKELNALRDSFNYEIDGLVIKVNDYSLQEEIGYTSRVPKWAVAYKFPAEEVETVVEDIFITVGRSGKCTPNAKLKTVKLAGTNVSYATLHNEDMIKNKDVRINDVVVVRKAGDIIPEVVRVNFEKRPNNSIVYEFPKKCPNCNGLVERMAEEAHHFCNNINCSAKIIESISHYASRDALNIEGLGFSTVTKLYNENILKSIADIYRLENKKEEILNLERSGEKSFNNLINSINNSKNSSLDKFIFGLGIRQVGEKTSKILASKFKNLENLFNVQMEELLQIDDIGEISSKIIYDFFQNFENRALINELLSLGVNPINQEIEIENSIFNEKTVVVTGTLENYSRKEIEDYLVKLGAKVSGSVSKKTDYLLCGKDSGSKLEKAKSLGVKIINEAEFIKILAEKW